MSLKIRRTTKASKSFSSSTAADDAQKIVRLSDLPNRRRFKKKQMLTYEDPSSAFVQLSRHKPSDYYHNELSRSFRNSYDNEFRESSRRFHSSLRRTGSGRRERTSSNEKHEKDGRYRDRYDRDLYERSQAAKKRFLRSGAKQRWFEGDRDNDNSCNDYYDAYLRLLKERELYEKEFEREKQLERYDFVPSRRSHYDYHHSKRVHKSSRIRPFRSLSSSPKRHRKSTGISRSRKKSSAQSISSPSSQSRSSSSVSAQKHSHSLQSRPDLSPLEEGECVEEDESSAADFTVKSVIETDFPISSSDSE